MLRELGPIVKAGNKETNKHSEAESSDVCVIHFQKNFPTSQNNSFANGQYSGIFLHYQNRGHPQQSFVSTSPKNLRLSG